LSLHLISQETSYLPAKDLFLFPHQRSLPSLPSLTSGEVLAPVLETQEGGATSVGTLGNVLEEISFFLDFEGRVMA
jgi:hypothetical protein